MFSLAFRLSAMQSEAQVPELRVLREELRLDLAAC